MMMVQLVTVGNSGSLAIVEGSTTLGDATIQIRLL